MQVGTLATEPEIGSPTSHSVLGIRIGQYEIVDRKSVV